MTVLLTLHIIVTIAMIVIILWQKSDGGSALLGASSSSSMFSARGVANLLTHTTAILAAIFLTLCIAMTWVATHSMRKSTLLGGDSPSSTTTPANEAPAPEVATNKDEGSKDTAAVDTAVPADQQAGVAAVPDKPTENLNKSAAPETTPAKTTTENA